MLDQILSRIVQIVSDPNFAFGAISGAVFVGYAVVKIFPKKWTTNKRGWKRE